MLTDYNDDGLRQMLILKQSWINDKCCEEKDIQLIVLQEVEECN